MAADVAPSAMDARLVSLEAQLATVTAQADADAINSEHLSQAMEGRYTALAAEHSQVRRANRMGWDGERERGGGRRGGMCGGVGGDTRGSREYIVRCRSRGVSGER